MKELNLSKGKALVVVAHPDDETIWMSGTILRYSSIDWTIFVLCRKNDPDRYPKFLCVAKSFGTRGIISDLDDEGKLTLGESLPEIEKRIMHNLKKKKFDYIFTHGSNGEYGHIRHRGVHRVVKGLLQKKKLQSRNVFFFAYTLNKNGKFCVPYPRAHFCVKLSEEEFKTKKDIIKNIYGFDEDSFEVLSCSQLESFTQFI